MHVILHPGFHKTGTSSLQRGLAANTNILSSRLQWVFMTEMPHVIRTTRRYSRKPKPNNLEMFGAEFEIFMAGLKPDPALPLLITSEDLSGHIPGKFEVKTYAASSALMDRAVDVVHARFGTGTVIDIWYTTRAPEAWQRSVYYQLLRGTRMRDDFATYSSKYSEASALENVVAETKRLVGNKANVDSGRLEDCAETALGPLGAFLERYGISSKGLPSLPVENVQPKGAAEELLAINRSALDDEAARDAKRHVLKRYRGTGATKLRVREEP